MIENEAVVNDRNNADSWFLEHVSTKRRVLLSTGENVIGRHSSCRIVLNEFYDYLSRQHLNIVVSNTGVMLRSMNAMNGVFLNGIRLSVPETAASEGDEISLSIQEPEYPVPARHGVFILKKTVVLRKEIIIVSDDDDTSPLPPGKSTPQQKMDVEFNLAQQLPNNLQQEAHKDVDINAEEPVLRRLHLPKISNVKEEGVNQVSNNIEDIFGKADDEILDAVLQLNPYVYNKLSTTSTSNVSNNKIMQDGDLIEVLENVPPQPNAPTFAIPNPPTLPPSPPADDYDENMELSQVVLQGMKEEMALDRFEIDGDKDYFMENGIKDEKHLPASNVFPDWYEDEIIVIEDDDEESFDKVTDWSLKLLTQNNAEHMEMSQVYPLDDQNDRESDDEDDKESDKEDTIHPQYHPEEPTTTECYQSKMQRCILEPTSIDKDASNTVTLFTRRKKAPTMEEEIIACLNRDNALAEEHLLFQRRRQVVEKQNQEKNDTITKIEVDIENMVEDICSEFDELEPIKKRTSNLISSKKDSGKDSSSGPPDSLDVNKLNRIIDSKQTPSIKEAKSISLPKPSNDTKCKKSSMRKRSKTVASLEDLSKESFFPQSSLETSNDISKPSHRRQRVTSLTSGKGLMIDDDIPPEQLPLKVDSAPEVDAGSSTTVNNQLKRKPSSEFIATREDVKDTKSLDIALPQEKIIYEVEKEPTKSGAISPNLDPEQSKKSLPTSRGVLVIDAPFMPTGRGKLRGVSATDSPKEKILHRQRSLDCQAEMKLKWYQKPKDKKKDDEKLKENRKEILKKIANDKKSDEQSGQKRKFNNTKVPRMNHTNRGSFLTDTDGPTETAPPLKKSKVSDQTKLNAPPQCNSIETSFHQLQAKTASGDDVNPQSTIINSSSTSIRRPPERRDAAIARSKRTCNRVTFASMEKEFELREKLNKEARRLRHVRFNLSPQIRYIPRVANTHSQIRKEALKLYMSTHQERREWSRQLYNKTKIVTDFMAMILKWGNEWLKVRSADVVAESDVLVPIPHEFKNYKQYKDTFVPLMKLELLTTVERSYKQCSICFEVSLKSFTNENNRYYLVTRTTEKFAWHCLYTLTSGTALNEVFAYLSKIHRVAENSFELVLVLLQDNIHMKQLSEIKTLKAKPVVDSLRVELGAFEAIYQLGCSPLFHRILTPSKNVQSVPKPITVYKGFLRLNDQQLEITMQTYQRVVDDGNASITLIQGPPGTGKSVVISSLCLQCLYGDTVNKLDRKILICAHSNTAVDNITLYLDNVKKKMSHNQFEFLRFGWFEKMSEKTQIFSLDHHLQLAKLKKLQRLTVEQLEILKHEHRELKTQINELRQQKNLSARLQQQLEQKQKQCQHIQDQLNPPLTPREEYEISHMVVRRANIVCTTLSSCVKLSRFIDYFDICFIDEATQCTEPWTLLPLRFAVKHLVLVGDTQQLPATVISQKAKDFGLANSLFDRIQRCLNDQLLVKPGCTQLVHTKIFKLSMQYRMHRQICQWPNRYFYEDQLSNAPCLRMRSQSPIIPYCVINLSFTHDRNDISNRSISNDKEACFISKLLVEMDKHMPTVKYTYGLISPYSNQCSAISQLIPKEMKISPSTVDSYQGLEKDVIIISNARTRGCGFLTNYQRLNVALTRAKRCLIICGNFDDLKSVELWSALLNDARDRGVYIDLQRDQAKDLRKYLMPKILVKPALIDKKQVSK